MGVKGMWGVNAAALAMLIVANLVLSATGSALWTILSAVALALMLFYCFRQGMRIGHDACRVRSTVESARKSGDAVYAQLDRRYLAQAWHPASAVKGIFASALIPYAVGGIYIILYLLRDVAAVPEAALGVSRLAAYLVSLPFWPMMMHWHRDFVTLTPSIVAALLLGPFLLPVCTALGYMQGPKLWARTEKAMLEGRRRAKARARVGKKLAPKGQKPEI